MQPPWRLGRGRRASLASSDESRSGRSESAPALLQYLVAIASRGSFRGLANHGRRGAVTIGAENWEATATCCPPSPPLPPKGEGRRRDGKLHDEVSHAQFRWRALDCPPRRPSPFGGRVGDGGNRTAKNAEIRLADPASELASFRRLWGCHGGSVVELESPLARLSP